MKFGLHPSEELVRLFREKPYQGQDPQKASVIFLSSDANYSPEISEHRFFNYILEYHQDGVTFWMRHGCHHPFMLPDYPLHKGCRPVNCHECYNYRRPVTAMASWCIIRQV